MKLTSNQQAPIFITQDVFGTPINLRELQGQKVYLAFERNAGCPICNLHTHQLLKQAAFFKTNRVMVVLVYESPVVRMKEYLGEEAYPFHFVSDPDTKLYGVYGVQRSWMKVMRSMFNGMFGKIKQGSALFRKPMKQDANLDRIPAEFIIDEKGVIQVAHYGKFVGDHLAMKELMRELE